MMTDQDLEHVLDDIRAGRDVRICHLNYAMCIANDAATAARGAEDRRARMLRGEREVNVYPTRDPARWVRGYLATAEQVAALLAAGARLEDPAVARQRRYDAEESELEMHANETAGE